MSSRVQRVSVLDQQTQVWVNLACNPAVEDRILRQAEDPVSDQITDEIESQVKAHLWVCLNEMLWA